MYAVNCFVGMSSCPQSELVYNSPHYRFVPSLQSRPDISQLLCYKGLGCDEGGACIKVACLASMVQTKWNEDFGNGPSQYSYRPKGLLYGFPGCVGRSVGISLEGLSKVQGPVLA